MDSKERAELLKKTLAMLETVEADPRKIKEIEKLLSQLSDDIEQSINKSDSHSDLTSYFHLNEMHNVVARTQFTLEKLEGVVKEIEQVKKELAKYVG